MSKVHSHATAIIAARPEEVYRVLVDYRESHPAILPQPYFNSGLTVEKGGQGAGTVLRFTMKVMGREYSYHQVVSEPEPGRQLVETEIERDLATTFLLDPVQEGTQTRLTISTDFSASPGLTGLLEKLFFPPVSRRIFKKELALIAAYLKTKNLSEKIAV